ncbi:N-(5'-phosphoribosyl)anthranilate isomerase [Gammaproteobacteria bacterium]|nr:N-(5'-phosphoribosyl)anthranilate isomerase [Gammaproteobacteria bacterium]
MHTKVKFCGFTQIQSILEAIELGADYLGFVFVHKSKRFVDADKLKEIMNFFKEYPQIRASDSGNNVKIVALFVDPSREYVKSIVKILQPDILQFHGSEDAAFCRSFKCAYIKAVPLGSDQANWVDYEKTYHDAYALLADSHDGTSLGGSGLSFDWSKIPAKYYRTLPLFLAGGLDESNVKAAILKCFPEGVDVSSGIEVATGIKSYERMGKFILAVKK